MKQTRDLGISEFILNPFTIKDLPRAIRRVMDGGGVIIVITSASIDARSWVIDVDEILAPRPPSTV
ncbi:MAG: hypothetical protein BWY88_00939 [Synergistetes bacterium ADurb.Bin520]|nr:MAG: hypothetical protein BWY88_00939 [Synergistetes bacterium ADurb.Bin520]